MFKKASVVAISMALWIPMIDLATSDGNRAKRYFNNKTFVSQFECQRSLQGLVNLVESIGMTVHAAKCVRK